MLISLLPAFRPAAPASVPELDLREWRRGQDAVRRTRPLPAVVQLERGTGALQAVAFTAPRPVVVRCVAGSAWITRERDVEDHVLDAGEERRFPAGSRLVAQGRPGSTLQLRFDTA